MMLELADRAERESVACSIVRSGIDDEDGSPGSTTAGG